MSTPSLQTPTARPDDYPDNGRVLLAAIISLSVVITFVVLLHAYARCLLQRRAVVVVTELPLHRRSLAAFPGHTTEPDEGLDAKMVALLPVFTVKEGRHGVGVVVDCVICLSVMEGGEKGRVLPGCKHGFHVECIDAWLMSHSRCPICRAAVRPEEGTADAAGAAVVVDLGLEEEVVRRNVTIGNEEMVVGRGGVESEASVEISLGSAASSSSSNSSSLGCSLKRLLSRSRLESRVFPSVTVN